MPRFNGVAQDVKPSSLEFSVVAAVLLCYEFITMKTGCVNTLQYLGNDILI